MIFQISTKSSLLRVRSKSSPFNLKILNSNGEKFCLIRSLKILSKKSAYFTSILTSRTWPFSRSTSILLIFLFINLRTGSFSGISGSRSSDRFVGVNEIASDVELESESLELDLVAECDVSLDELTSLSFLDFDWLLKILRT